MGLRKIINNLKVEAQNTNMVNMVSFGDIQLYDDKATIKYPYINLDVVTSSVVNFSQTYTIRVYVCDRNQPYIAYNKTEMILNDFMKKNDIDVNNYIVNYFTLDFKDMINGVWCDLTISDKIHIECIDDLGEGYILQENDKYVLQENGDLIRINN